MSAIDYTLETKHRLFADEALSAFNNVMAMETFSLLDDEKQFNMRADLTLPEIYKTRLLRTDLGPRSRTDPFQRWFHRYLRGYRYWKLSRSQSSVEGLGALRRGHRWSYQNTALVASILGRVTSAVMTCFFLVVPLAILSADWAWGAQLTIVSVCILVFSFLVAIMLKVSNFEMMALSAAYAAVLSVFVSNGPNT